MRGWIPRFGAGDKALSSNSLSSATILPTTTTTSSNTYICILVSLVLQILPCFDLRFQFCVIWAAVNEQISLSLDMVRKRVLNIFAVNVIQILS